MAMKCPNCVSKDLAPAKLSDRKTEVNWCRSCRGIWFEDGQLEHLFGKLAVDKAHVPDYARDNPHRECPVCRTPLAWFCYPGGTILIDMCRGCGGIWLDDHELTQLQAAVHAERELITCPKCGTRQPKAEECTHCGIVFSKYRATEDADSQHPVPKENGTPKDVSKGPTTIKGSLLRFIDRAIDTLTTY